ncbi:NAD(P)H-dependent oxidoreductase subunit E [Mycetohabitans sp. B5]|nr:MULTISPECIES: NAD(P)H-dependent oxidoreductase subunit E [Mycetohabitans]MCG1053904.1 NAD(P)H-dependent oxidoreductase subunit E [Mycetohabitans sp. B5]
MAPDAAARLVAHHTGAAARAVPGHSLLSVLHAIQDDVGYIPDGVIAPLAHAMNLSRAEVHGVITYYHHFRTSPPAPVTVHLCRAESCRAMGSESLARHAETHTGRRFDACHHGDDHRVAPPASASATPRADNHPAVELQSVYCLGLCSTSPAMMVNGKPYAHVTPAKFDTALAAAIGDARSGAR